MKKRYLFLDILRAIAIAEMIHGHSLDALLSLSLRSTPFFFNWNYIRGFTAPIFIFASGFAFAISTIPKCDKYTRFSKAFFRRIKKIFFIILLGYLMYLPYFSLTKTILSIGTPQWQSFLSVDILRCIGVSALFLQVWFFLKPTRVVNFMFIALLTVLLPALKPILSSHPVILGLPDFLRYYFTLSHFLLLFYTSYIFLGFLIGKGFIEKRKIWVRTSILTALFFIVMAQVLKTTGLSFSLESFMVKGGAIILLTVLLERLENLWQRMPCFIKYFGQESLLIYVVHIMIIYSSPVNKGLNFFWGPILSYKEVYLTILWLITAMFVLAYTWHKIKNENPVLYQWIKYSVYGGFVILFLIKPY